MFYGNQHVNKKSMSKTKKFVMIFVIIAVAGGSFQVSRKFFPRILPVKADTITVEVPVGIKYEDIPQLVRICNSEVTGNPKTPTYQFLANGDVVRGTIDKSDIGACQINERYNNDTARRLGYDIFTEKGNKEFAVWLYLNRGTQPWDASKFIWNK